MIVIGPGPNTGFTVPPAIPPPPFAALPVKVLLLTVNAPPTVRIPPPWLGRLGGLLVGKPLPLKVLLFTVRVPKLAMPAPPRLLAPVVALLLTVLFVSITLPNLIWM